VQLTPVLVQPFVPERYAEELTDEAVLKSPDPHPAGVAWDGTSLWVAGRHTNRIYRVDPVSGEVQESFAAPGRFPTCLAWDRGRLWHTDARTRKLYCLANGKIVREFPLDWEGVGVAVDGEGLIVGDWQSDKLRVVSAETGKVLRTLDAPDKNLWGLAKDQQNIWCARDDYLIVQDAKRCLPIGGFSVTGRRPDARMVTDLAIASEWIWYADNHKGRLIKIRKPSHGQQIAARGSQREATFWMKVRNNSKNDWQAWWFLANVPVYEMPGQRYLDYTITPPPVAHYRDPDGNLHALYHRDRFSPSDELHIQVRVRLWSADRWVFLDPHQAVGEIPADVADICREDFPGKLPLTDPVVRDFARAAMKGETNSYWKLRRVHDALLDRVTYAPPPDESVTGLLESGKGVCRNLSVAMQALGRIVDVPVLDAWAPHHNLVCAYLPGAGWCFIEVTANNAKETTNRWQRTVWFGGLPSGQLTTGVRGRSILCGAAVRDVQLANRWHCRIPKGLVGFSHQADWKFHAIQPTIRPTVKSPVPEVCAARPVDLRTRLTE
jgi:hypothetical protein